MTHVKIRAVRWTLGFKQGDTYWLCYSIRILLPQIIICWTISTYISVLNYFSVKKKKHEFKCSSCDTRGNWKVDKLPVIVFKLTHISLIKDCPRGQFVVLTCMGALLSISNFKLGGLWVTVHCSIETGHLNKGNTVHDCIP